MNVVTGVKFVAGMAASFGAGEVVRAVVTHVTPAETTAFQKASLTVGGCVLGGIAGSKASKYVSECIDDVVAIKESFVSTVKEG